MAMKGLSDMELFSEIKKGDQKALESLFVKYYESLCNFSYTISNNKYLAEEIVSDIFYNIWNRKDTLEFKISLKAYLFAAVKNNTLQKITINHEMLSFNSDHHNLKINSDSPEEVMAYNELYSAYQRAYETLPKQCRLIFKLNKIDGMKYKEIGNVLDISIKTVENQMMKALKLIRAAIKKHRMERG